MKNWFSQIAKRGRTDGSPVLDDALADWHRSSRPDEHLSSRARAQILHDVQQEAQPTARLAQPLTALFLPGRRFAVAAALPILAVTLLLGGLLVSGDGLVLPEEQGSARLLVRKQGDEVVFVIANGGRSHRVFRTTEVGGIEAAPLFATAEESFRDRLASDSDLVLYRVE